MSPILLVLLAGAAAGVLNAVGGGGKFIALPALVAAGLPPVTANAAATIALAPGAVVSASVSRRDLTPVGEASTRGLTAVSVVGQFVLGIYGGYFGGAVGIMMLALWSGGLGLDIAASNPMRITQLAAVYGSSAVLFLLTSDVLATPLLLAGMLAGAAAGGFAGAHAARRLPARLLRGALLISAVTTTALYFLRT